MTERIRAVGYARVSTLKQKKYGESLADQQKRIRAYATARGWQLVRIYTEAKSARGYKERPEYDRMTSDVLTDGIGVVIVTKVDRLGRNTWEFLSIFRKLAQKGVHVVIIDLSLDTTTPSGRLVLTVMAGLAEFETDQIRERTTMGREAKKARGEYIGGQPPYGWEVGAEKKLVRNAEEQRTLARIRRLQTRGMSLRKIAARLNQDGQLTRRGTEWSAQLLHQTLKGKRRRADR